MKDSIFTLIGGKRRSYNRMILRDVARTISAFSGGVADCTVRR